MRRADRLFALVHILRRDRLTTAARLARELGVTERTVYRDVRDVAATGVPIESEAGVGYRLPKHVELPPLMFTRDELEALALGLRVTGSWAGGDLAEAAGSALSKIDAALPSGARARAADARLHAPGFHVPPERLRHLDALRLAVRDRRKVSVRYVSARGEGSARVLRPLGLFFWGSTWSLAAWCELRRDFRSFRLDRIVGLETLPEGFEPGPGEGLEDYERRFAEEMEDERGRVS